MGLEEAWFLAEEDIRSDRSFRFYANQTRQQNGRGMTKIR